MPIMPYLHDALYIGGFAGLVVVARQALGRHDLRLSGLPGFERLSRPFGRGSAPGARRWFASVRPSGNTAFDAWRDGEINRIEAQRHALKARLEEFERFVDKLKHAEDRATFDRFVAEHPDVPVTMVDIAGTADRLAHRPG